MKALKRIHFYLGLIVVVHFLITGLFMRQNIFLIEPEDTTVRMMFRANHIYILFTGLINLLISYCCKRDDKVNILHQTASTSLILATIGISISFYIDPIKHVDLTTHLIQRKLTGYSAITCLIGTALHLAILQFHDINPAEAQTRLQDARDARDSKDADDTSV
jgi:hypothetical protein